MANPSSCCCCYSGLLTNPLFVFLGCVCVHLHLSSFYPTWPAHFRSTNNQRLNLLFPTLIVSQSAFFPFLYIPSNALFCLYSLFFRACQIHCESLPKRGSAFQLPLRIITASLHRCLFIYLLFWIFEHRAFVHRLINTSITTNSTSVS
jgi:hypothetical protein